MLYRVRCMLLDTTAATAIEYALLAGAIALAIAGAVGAIGDQLVPVFQTLVDVL